MAEIRDRNAWNSSRSVKHSGACCSAITPVQCWGDNYWGELGDGTTLSHPLPSPVLLASGVPLTGVGNNHGCALLADNTVWCWGQNYAGQLGNGTNVGDSAVPPQVMNLPACF